MNREQTLGATWRRPKHPKYRAFTPPRQEALEILQNPIAGAGNPLNKSSHTVLGEAWVIFTRDYDDPEIEAALRSEDPSAAFRRLYGEEMPISEQNELWEYLKQEQNACSAAATKAAPRRGKSKASEASSPTT